MSHGRSGISAVLFSIPLLVAGAGTALATPPNVMLDNTPGQPMTHTAPMIRSLGAKVVAVWNDTQTGSSTEPRIHYAVSTDSGATFTDLGAPPAPVNVSGTWRWRGDPQLVLDPATGAFYCAAYASFGSQLAVWVVKGNFSGPSLVWDPPVMARHVGASAFRAGLLALDTGIAGGSLHLLVHNLLSGAIEYHRSIDGNGATWSAPVTLSSPGDVGTVAYPRIVAARGDSLYAAWLGPAGYGAQPIRLRRSSDLGATWESEQTPATMRMNPLFPGSSQLQLSPPHRTQFSLAANRIAGSSTFGRVALAWGESWDFSDEPFPALTGSVLRSEIELNDTEFDATAFTVGDALIGNFTTGTDLDFWSVALTAGQAVGVWADSTTGNGVRLFILGPDARSMGNAFEGIASNAVVFRAQVAGTYWIRAEARGFAASNSYRIRTRSGSPAPGEARDQRDLAVAYSTPGGWTVNRWAFGPSGYDDYLPTVGFASDGLDYVTWYDLSRGSVSGASHLVVARNLAGSDPVASPPVTVTDAESNWNEYVVFVPPGVGATNDVSGDAARVHFAWTDLRGQATNAFAASVTTGAVPVAFPADTTVMRGTTVTLHGQVLNRNPLFDEKVFARVTGARAWPGALVARDSVPPGSTGVISIPIAIPDTAAVGPYTVTVSYERQSGIVLGSDPVTLTIQSATGVGEPALTARLEPVAPNPARGAARIAFTLARPGDARVEVFGLQGNRLRTLVHGTLPAGDRAVHWDGRDDAGRPVPAGLYFVTLEGAGFRAVRPLVMLK